MTNPCFQRLYRCGILCRTTVFTDTPGKITDGKKDEPTPFADEPIKARKT